jgi:hypothetical protein
VLDEILALAVLWPADAVWVSGLELERRQQLSLGIEIERACESAQTEKRPGIAIEGQCRYKTSTRARPSSASR